MKIRFFQHNVYAMAFGLCFFLFSAHLFAVEKFAVVVNIDSPIPRLSQYQLSTVYLDKSREIHGISVQPVDLKKWDGVKESFYKQVIHKDSSQLNAYWARKLFTGRGKPPRSFIDVKSIYHFMGKNDNVIAYIPQSEVDLTQVKVIYKGK